MASSALATAFVNIVPGTKAMESYLKGDLGKQAGKAGTAAGDGFSNSFNASVKRLIGPAIFATLSVAITRFGADAVKSASNLQAEFEGVNQVFGDGAQAVQAYAKQAASLAGITETEALSAAKNMGVFAKSAGLAGSEAAKFSINMVQLAGDLGSFNDVPTGEALAAIQSGLLGQAEPLRRFGVLLDDVTLRNRAMEMGLTKTTKDALTPQQKVLAAYSEILKQTSIQQGDFVKYQDTFGNAIKTVNARFDEIVANIGEALIPALESVMPQFRMFIDDLGPKLVAAIKEIPWEDLADRFMQMVTWLVDNRDALIDLIKYIGIFAGAVGTYKTAMKIATIATETFTASFKLSPLMAVIGGITLLIVAVEELNKAIGNAPKQDLLRKSTTAANKAGQAAYDKYLASAKREMTNTGPGSILPSEIAAAERARQAAFDASMKQAQKISDNLNAGIAAQQKKASTDITLPDMFSGAGNSSKTAAAAAKKIKAIIDKANKGIAKANTTYTKAVDKANARFVEDQTKIWGAYNDKVADLTARRDAENAKAAKDHSKNILAIQQDFNSRLADIVQQSKDRLRNAFESVTAVDVGKTFADLGKKTIDNVIKKLQGGLTKAKNLVTQTTALANAGFSQTFIEQVVAQGPDAGAAFAKAILAASPDAQAQLQALFAETETVSAHGMDMLANSIYEKTGLATEALRSLYAQTQVELDNALIAENLRYTEEQANILAKFNEGMAEAKATRDAALAEAEKTLTEALTAATTALNESLKAIETEFNNALKEFKGQLSKHAQQIKAIKDEISAARAEAMKPIVVTRIENVIVNTKAATVKPFANGGFVNGPVNALIGEAGPEVVTPLKDFERMMGLDNGGGKTINYYAAPNQSLDAEQQLFMAIKRAKAVGSW